MPLSSCQVVVTTIITLVVLLHKFAQGANILFYHNVASYSHRVATWPLAQALAQRGHYVTVISPFYYREPNPNITEIVPQSVAKYVNDWLGSEFDINLRVNKTLPPLVSHIFSFGRETCKLGLTSPEVHKWLNATDSLDLVIIDNAVAECGVSIAYKYRAKHIFFSTVVSHPHEAEFLGFVPESFAIPELEEFPVTAPMSLMDRVLNTATSLIWKRAHGAYMDELNQFTRNHLNMPHMPHLYDLARNASLVFYTGDPSTDFPRTHPPFFINIAGIHCDNIRRPLPQEIQSFLQNGKSEFVYISLGSLVVSSNLPENIKAVFFQTIESLPHIKFLWKWNGDFPATLPTNLLLAKWFPQTDLLAHPKILAFVTQSGRPSTLEAIYHGVPMIAFPVIGDQDVNANRVNYMGGNIKLELGRVSYEKLHGAVSDMISNQSMWKQRMSKLQSILRDRPMSPLNTAVWWTEYVLRHDNLDHLKPAGFHQPWYQRRLLDVYALLFVGIVVFVAYAIAFVFFSLKLLECAYISIVSWNSWIESRETDESICESEKQKVL